MMTSTDGYLRLKLAKKKKPITYVKEHHMPPTQVKRNPVVDLDSTSYEAYKLLFDRNTPYK